MNVVTALAAAVVGLTFGVRVLGDAHPTRAVLRAGDTTDTVTVAGDQVFDNGRPVRYLAIPARGSVRVELPGDSTRTYPGGFLVYGADRELVLVNSVPEQEYLASVLAGEMPEAPAAALRAQAIVARTFSYYNIRRHGSYDFCDGTHCQVYSGTARPRSLEAVTATDGLVLTFGGELCDVYYHSTCGGRTALPAFKWTGADTIPYIASVDDSDFCQQSPWYDWRASVSRQALDTLFDLGGRIDSLAVRNRAADRRLEEVLLYAARPRVIPGPEFRRGLDRLLGAGALRTDLLTLALTSDSLTVAGHGNGHGVGFCQWGAIGMARRGYDTDRILAHYFPGTRTGCYQSSW